MPEELKNSTPEEGDAGKITFGAVSDVLMAALIYEGVWNLQHEIEDKAPGVNWKNPAIALEYAVPWPEEDEGLTPDQVEKARAIPITAEEAQAITDRVFKNLPDAFDQGLMEGLTGGVAVMTVEGEEGPKPQVLFPQDKTAEYEAVPVDKRDEYAARFLDGFTLTPAPSFTGKDEKGNPYAGKLGFQILPLNLDFERHRAFYLVLIALDFREGDPSAWSPKDKTDFWEELAAPYQARTTTTAGAEPSPSPSPSPDRVMPYPAERFRMAGGYGRPIFTLSKTEKDSMLLRDFYEPQTPLNRAVGFVLFSLTDVKAPDRIQEARPEEIEDRVHDLSQQDAYRHGQHRPDIVAELFKMLTTEIPIVVGEDRKVGRYWTRRVTVGYRTVLQYFGLVYEDAKTGKRVYPSDPAFRSVRVPMKVESRRQYATATERAKAKTVWMLPQSARWKLVAYQWQFNDSFGNDLLFAPALDAKGNVKKTASGKVIRTGSHFLLVTKRIHRAFLILRSDPGGHRLYAQRLLEMLVFNIAAKREDKTRQTVEIAADRVFRMLGIPDDPKHPERREEIVARAVLRLQERDIGALLAGSDQRPRLDPNPNRRTSPFYRFIRSPEFAPKVTLTTEEEAKVIEAEQNEPPALPAPKIEKAETGTLFPDLAAPKPVIPTGPEIRAAREAAGLTLRAWAKNFKDIGGPSFKTWSLIETERRSDNVGRIPPEVWSRVQDFIAKRKAEGKTEGRTE